MSSSVEKIKERLDVADVIGSYIKLEKAGVNFKGKCPFHNEKTPSFFVSPSRGSFYCFGCGAKGDIFTFVQEFEGLDFVGSLKLLADRAGITLEDMPRGSSQESDKLRDVLEIATSFFERNLEHITEASGYLKKRGITQDTIRSWRIGAVSDDWRTLYSHLKEKGIGELEMERAGLIKRSDKGGEGERGFYDVFRGRIMFPIFDQSGRVIAFSGRLLKDDPKAPKYLNSPETALFNKSETLYGLDRAKLDIRKKDYSILVEGQFDLLMCHQAGFGNVVASSGTAFTEFHLRRLQKLSNRLILAFDSDRAGFSAALKSGVLALSLGMEVKIASLPNGSDPADLILASVDSWKNALRNAKHLVDFHLDNLLETAKDSRSMGKEVEKKILPYVAILSSSMEQSHFVSQISKKTGIREEAIWNDLRKAPKVMLQETVGSKNEVDPVTEEAKRRKTHIERKLAGIMWWQESSKDEGGGNESRLIKEELGRVVGEKRTQEIFLSLEPVKDELIFEAEAYYQDGSRLYRETKELLLNFEEDTLREEFVKTMVELEKTEKAKEQNKAAELLKQCQDISQKLAALSRRRQEET